MKGKGKECFCDCHEVPKDHKGIGCCDCVNEKMTTKVKEMKHTHYEQPSKPCQACIDYWKPKSNWPKSKVTVKDKGVKYA